jgi:hypothetical protein
MTSADGSDAILNINFSLQRRVYFKLQNCTSGVIFADWTMPDCHALVIGLGQLLLIEI